MRYICIWAESPPELSLAEVSCHVCGLLMSASAATEAQEAANTWERRRERQMKTKTMMMLLVVALLAWL